LFDDERDLAEIESPEFPGERLVVCKNLPSPMNASASETSRSMRPSKT